MQNFQDILYNLPAASAKLILIYILFVAVTNALLCLAVIIRAKENDVSNKGFWIFITAVFGLVGYIVFTAIHIRWKIKIKTTLLQLVCVLIWAGVYIGGAFAYSLNAIPYISRLAYSDEYAFTKHDVTYENADGDKVIYDKYATEYKNRNLSAFSYYDKNGNICYLDDEYSETDENGSLTELKSLYIDEDGWANILPDNSISSVYSEDDNYDEIHFDDNGKLYYPPEVCYWTPDGELTFSDDYFFKDKTYDEVIEIGLKNDSFYRQCIKNDDGIYVFCDKKGNEYKLSEAYRMCYYDRNGKVYDDNSFDSDDSYYIDEDGYLVKLEGEINCVSSWKDEYASVTEFDIWYDNYGNLYYNPYDCSWDKNGNLIFVNETLNDLTYYDVTKLEK